MDKLGQLRKQLDELDRQLLESLRKRLETVAEVVRVKAAGLPFLRDHDRESEILARIGRWARELGLDEFRSQEIFREVIAMSLKAQEEELLQRERQQRSASSAWRVAYPGTPGSYSYLAARKYFASKINEMELSGYPSVPAALDAVERGEAGYAVMPLENTKAGSINETYDLLRNTPLKMVGEELLAVRLHLVGLEGAEISSLRRVMSHPETLTLCSRFLRSLESAEVVAYRDTASAARAVSETGDPTHAAVASEDAAERAGLAVLKRDIADSECNWTRFAVVSPVEIKPDPRIPAKTSLVLATGHQKGDLARCLEILAMHDLNLTKIESRPDQRSPWQYLFYLDFEGSLASDSAALAVAELRRECPYLHIIGSYPARTTKDGTVDRVL